MAEPYDVAVVGAGGAGQLLLLALATADLPLRVAVVDPVTRSGQDRTWCWWSAGPDIADEAVDSSWRRVRLAGGGMPEQVQDLDPLRYRLIRSADLYALVAERVAAATMLRVDRYESPAGEVTSVSDGVAVELDTGALRARWGFDSRPRPPVTAGHVRWQQQFLGWVVPAAAVPGLDEVPLLMDFRTAQPRTGLSFGYCLPMRDGSVLVEYTEFSPEPMVDAAASAALLGYLTLLGMTGQVTPHHVERGSIPMTDARYARGDGRRVYYLGTAGGATRGSTGYTFAAMVRQAGQVAASLAGGDRPHVPPAYPARHRWMDAVMLRALDDGLLDGPTFFRQLFDRQPAQRVLRFLDGATTRAEELAVMSASPLPAMTRAALVTAPSPFAGHSRPRTHRASPAHGGEQDAGGPPRGGVSPGR